MSLFQIIYQSMSLVPFEGAELTALLQHSQASNRRNGISGVLLYTPDGRFLQVLEGERDAVRALYHERIARDPRHFNCQVLSEGPSPERCFPSWSMGFRTAQAQDLRKLLTPVPASSPALLVPRPHTRPELLALLQEFVASGEAGPARELPW
jgi:hypothetical protein